MLEAGKCDISGRVTLNGVPVSGALFSLVCYEAVVFESKVARQALADSPEQDARYRRLL